MRREPLRNAQELRARGTRSYSELCAISPRLRALAQGGSPPRVAPLSEGFHPSPRWGLSPRPLLCGSRRDALKHTGRPVDCKAGQSSPQEGIIRGPLTLHRRRIRTLSVLSSRKRAGVADLPRLQDLSTVLRRSREDGLQQLGLSPPSHYTARDRRRLCGAVSDNRYFGIFYGLFVPDAPPAPVQLVCLFHLFASYVTQTR